MPPIWEYGPTEPSGAPGDLAESTRYVVSTCCSRPRRSIPLELPTGSRDTVNLDSNTYEGWAGVDASASYIKSGLLLQELQELPAATDSLRQPGPAFAGEASRCYFALLDDESCYPDGLPAVRELLPAEHVAAGPDQVIEGGQTTKLPLFNYAVGRRRQRRRSASPTTTTSTAPSAMSSVRLAGHRRGRLRADHDDDPRGRPPLGMSHPHDGYDSTSGVDFGPADEFFFAWAGRRDQLDDELHRPELGLQPVRPRQLRPTARRRLLR